MVNKYQSKELNLNTQQINLSLIFKSVFKNT